MKKLKILSIFFVLVIFSTISIHHIISFKSRDFIYSSIDTLPLNKVGLVLGTSKYLSNGNLNLYYLYRIEAAVSLYKSDKIEYLLVSGDNGQKEYDEPSDFKKDLIARGIPEDRIFLDYAGFRTLDSVIRAKEIFGQKTITIISQQFHNERAIFLANNHDINAVAFNAKEPNNNKSASYREYLARIKAVIDIIFDVEPKYLGDPIVIK